MMMPALWALLFLTVLLLQAVFLPVFFAQGLRPDLFLIITVSAGLLYGREHGVGFGFFTGLVQDLAAGGIFGLHSLPKLLIGFAAGTAERKVFKEHILLPLAAMAVATTVQYLMTLALLFLFGFKVEVIPAVMHNLLPLVFCNMLFSVPLHWVVHKIGRLHQ